MFRFINRFWALRSPEALTEAHPGDCEALQPLLSARMDDELTQAERRRVEAHLESCAACRVDLSEMEACRSQLQFAGEVEIPSAAQAAIRSALRLEFAHAQPTDTCCSQIRPLLSPFMDAELSDLQRDAVTAHVDDCRECAAHLKTLRRTVRLVASLPPVAPPATLRALVLARTSQRPGRIPLIPASVGALALAGILFLVLPPPAQQPSAPITPNRVAEISTGRFPPLSHTDSNPAAAPAASNKTSERSGRTVASENPRFSVIQRVPRVSASALVLPKENVRPVASAEYHPIVAEAPVIWRPVIARPSLSARPYRAPIVARPASDSSALLSSHGHGSGGTVSPFPQDLIARETPNPAESPDGEIGSKVAVVGAGTHPAAPSMPIRPPLPGAGQADAPPPTSRLSPVVTAMAAPPANTPGIWTARSFTASADTKQLSQDDQDQQNMAAVARMNRQTQFYLHQTRAMEPHPGSVTGQSINGYTLFKLANGHGGVKW